MQDNTQYSLKKINNMFAKRYMYLVLIRKFCFALSLQSQRQNTEISCLWFWFCFCFFFPKMSAVRTACVDGIWSCFSSHASGCANTGVALLPSVPVSLGEDTCGDVLLTDVPRLFSSIERFLFYEQQLWQQSWFPSVTTVFKLGFDNDQKERLSYTN